MLQENHNNQITTPKHKQLRFDNSAFIGDDDNKDDAIDREGALDFSEEFLDEGSFENDRQEAEKRSSIMTIFALLLLLLIMTVAATFVGVLVSRAQTEEDHDPTDTTSSSSPASTSSAAASPAPASPTMASVPEGWILDSILNGQDGDYQAGKAIAFSPDGTTLAISSRDQSTERWGHITVYRRRKQGSWWPLGQTLAAVAGDSLDFTNSVAISTDGSIVAVADSTRAAGVALYQLLQGDTTWRSMGEVATEASQQAVVYHGISVAISGNGQVVAVGAPNGRKAGRVYVYQYLDQQWQPFNEFPLITDDTPGGQDYGYSVALSHDGTTLAIGNPRRNELLPGSVRIFQFQNAQLQPAGVSINGGTRNDFFGAALAFSAHENSSSSSNNNNNNGLMLAIGAPGTGEGGFANPGYAQIFMLDSSDQWIPAGTIQGNAYGDHFGCDLAVSRDGAVVAIAANQIGNNAGSGYAKLFEQVEGEWVPGEGVFLGEQETSRRFGQSIALALDGTTNDRATIVVGDSHSGRDFSGSVSVFTTK